MHTGTVFRISNYLKEVRFGTDSGSKDGRVRFLAFRDFWLEELTALRLDADAC